MSDLNRKHAQRIAAAALSLGLALFMTVSPYAYVTVNSGGTISGGSGTSQPRGGTAASTQSPDAADYASTGGVAGGTLEISSLVPSGCYAIGTAEADAASGESLFTEAEVYTYDNMVSDLESMRSRYSGLMTVTTIGTSADGRSIYEAIVGNRRASTHVLITGSIHGREYITTSLVMKQLDHILRNSGSGAFDGKSIKTWLNDVCLHFVPMINPDGVSISQFGEAGIRSESLRANLAAAYANDLAAQRTSLEYAAYLRRWKANANGVNLNDNFNANVQYVESRVNGVSSDGYYGTPASEPETKAIQSLIDGTHFKAIVNYHAMGNVIYWNYEGNQLVEHSRDIANNISALTGYSMQYTGYEGGSVKAYAGTRFNPSTSVTVEVGSTEAPVSYSEMPVIWAQNMYVPYYVMKWAKEKGK